MGASLFLGGVWTVVSPQEMVMVHQTASADGRRTDSYVEYVSEGKSRLYGGIAMLCGIGLLVAVFSPSEEK